MNEQEKEIRRMYNEIIITDLHKKILISDHFGFFTKEYESISDFFSEFNLKYDKETKTIKEKILILSQINKLFDFKHFKINYLPTKRNLLILKQDLIGIDLLLKELLDYNNYMSFLIIGYRDTFVKLINFYEKNLVLTFNFREIDNLISKIHNLNLESNDYFLPTNPDIISVNFKQNNKYLVAFANLLDRLYVYDKLHKYTVFSIAEINDFLKNNANKIDSSNVNYANKNLTKINSNFLMLEKKMSAYDFEQVEIISKYLISELLNIKKKLQLNFKASEFFLENKNTLIEIIFLIKKKYPEIKTNLLKIEQNFSTDPNVLDLAKKNATNLTNLFLFVEKLDLSTEQNLTSEKILVISKQIIFEIISWVNSCEVMLKSIKSKYNFFKIVIKEIASNKLIISQMLAFIKLNNINDDKKTSNITNLKSNLENLEKKIFLDFNNNFDYHCNSLLDISEEINLLKEYLVRTHCAKIYIEKILWEINLKIFQSKKFNLSTTEIIKTYTKGNYIKCANDAIKFLRHHFR